MSWHFPIHPLITAGMLKVVPCWDPLPSCLDLYQWYRAGALSVQLVKRTIWRPSDGRVFWAVLHADTVIDEDGEPRGRLYWSYRLFEERLEL